MIRLFLALLYWLSAFFRSRHRLGLELAVLHQQLSVLKHKNPRPRLVRLDRLFWVARRHFWGRWSEALVIVKPETVARWHREGFRLYWGLRSRCKHRGRPELTLEVRELIQRMAAENPTWGAPRIHGELLKLGFVISERTVSRYLARVGPRREAGNG
jgi:putative transposase